MNSVSISVTFCLLAVIAAGAETGLTYQSHQSPIKVRSCPGETPKASLSAVYIENCVEEPCIFRKGQNVSMEMDLDILGPVQSLEARLYAIVLGVPVRWDGVNPEACQDIVSEGARCPLSTGDYITYAVTLSVGALYPTVIADVKYLVLDEKQETQICWMVKASVVPA